MQKSKSHSMSPMVASSRCGATGNADAFLIHAVVDQWQLLKNDPTHAT